MGMGHQGKVLLIMLEKGVGVHCNPVHGGDCQDDEKMLEAPPRLTGQGTRWRGRS